jgi:hypothetical protein
MAVTKKRVIKSLDKLSDQLKDLMSEQYPNGYEASITRIKNAKNEPIFVFPLETEDAVYLVKVPATKNSDGGYDVESGKPQEFDKGGDEAGDNFAGGDDFDSEYDGGEDEDGGGGGKSNREASYDPDFDS